MKEVNAFYSSERTARAALGKLLKENIVLKIRNGLYTCVSGENGGPVANRFQVASAITPSSYVSHHTAFEYYGTVDQIFYEVYVGSEMRFHDFEKLVDRNLFQGFIQQSHRVVHGNRADHGC